MRFGLQLWSQRTSWPEFRDAVRMPAPNDRATIERMPEVRELLTA